MKINKSKIEKWILFSSVKTVISLIILFIIGLPIFLGLGLLDSNTAIGIGLGITIIGAFFSLVIGIGIGIVAYFIDMFTSKYFKEELRLYVPFLLITLVLNLTSGMGLRLSLILSVVTTVIAIWLYKLLGMYERLPI